MAAHYDLMPSPPGPSSARHRPASEAVFTRSASERRPPHASPYAAYPTSPDRSMQPTEPALSYDVYQHPKAIAYQQQHPRRSLPKFGPYLLLQTLGEGEFGKVKLGLHEEWGEEVAVKLMRRGNVDNQVRLSKVEREIEVLKKLKHPNIVRLYDVIETDKYIGIILEYASGGELFDHILAHRYLREKDACKLFAQLISGVWYIHQKKIVHRDLKLENLLLDRNRNVIITDFGFANRFEHKADDLMVTSCGSPCYAAPELVISEGAYVGSAVDVWSCGVILYAMLAGYLPFDDDPSNPDGDNINLLYKYIVSTTLTFPDYVSEGARHLLGIMLVPDPKYRASLQTVMQHEWLAPYRPLFQRSVDQLEQSAAEAAQQKREAYIKSARAARQALLAQQQQQMARMARSQTVSPGGMPMLTSDRRPGISGSATADFTVYESHQEPIYNAPPSATSARRVVASAIVMPTSAGLDQDSMMEPSQMYAPQSEIPQRTRKESAPHPMSTPRVPRAQPAPAPGPPPPSSESQRRRASHRHTVQVEYETPEPEPFPSMPAPLSGAPPGPAPQVQQGPQRPSQRTRTSSDAASILLSGSLGVTAPVLTTAYGQPEIIIPQPSGTGRKAESPANIPQPLPPVSAPPSTPPKSRKPSVPTTPPVVPGLTPRSPHMPRVPNSTPITPHPARNAPQIAVSSPGTSPAHRRATITESSVPHVARHDEASPITPTGDTTVSPLSASCSSNTNPGDASISSSNVSGAPSRSTTASSRTGHRKGLSMEHVPGQAPRAPVRGPDSMPPVSGAGRTLASRMSGGLGSSTASTELSDKEKKKGRRTTLSLLPNFNSSVRDKERRHLEPPRTAVPSSVSQNPPLVTPDYSVPPIARSGSHSSGPTGSTAPAKQVMNWFRKKSQAKNGAPGMSSWDSSASDNVPAQPSVPQPSVPLAPGAPGPKLVITTTAPIEERYAAPPRASPVVQSAGARVFDATPLRLHEGATDHSHVTIEYPPVVMQKVAETLRTMGVEFSQETPFRYRCVRHKRKTSISKSNTGLGFSGMIASGGPPSSSRNLLANSGTSTMLKGLLRRGSQNPAATGLVSPVLSNGSEDTANGPHSANDTVDNAMYGDISVDKGDEVRFYVELTRLEKMQGTYSLDIRRLKGSLGGFKVVYETLRDRLKLAR